MVKMGWKAAISLLVAFAQLSALAPVIQGGSISTFSGGLFATDATLTGGGTVVFANLSIPVNCVLLESVLNLSPLSVGGKFPLAPSLDVAADGKPDWKFEGPGLGAFGKQELFSDGAGFQQFVFPSPGNETASILLPRDARVQAASVEVEGATGQRWWNTSWRNRVALAVTELAGRDQTAFPVETLLDTRNWTLGSAEREFRVTRVNSSTLEETEVPIQVVDEVNDGTKCLEAGLLFEVSNLTAGATVVHHLYFNVTVPTARSPLFRDFHPRLIQNGLLPQFWTGRAGESSGGGSGSPLPPGNSNYAFFSPSGVTVDSTGRMFVSDSSNHRVQIYSAAGEYQMTLGMTNVPGGDLAHFFYPRGLDLTPDGKLLVADGGTYMFTMTSSNNRVLIFNDLNDTLADGVIGVSGLPGNDSGHLNQPWDVSANASGRVAVADKGYIIYTMPWTCYGFRVQLFKDLSDTLADGTLGTAGAPGMDATHLKGPFGVGMSDTGTVFVADTQSNRILQYDDGDALPDKIMNMQGTPGTDPYKYNFPQDVDVNSTGWVFVADTGNHRVLAYDSAWVHKFTIGETGVNLSDALHLNGPAGIKLGGDDKIYIADTGNNRILRISPARLDIGAPETLEIPRNVSLDFGRDGTPEWSHAGCFNSKVLVTGLAAAIEGLLAGANGTPDAYGNVVVPITLNLTNAGTGSLALANLSIIYDCARPVPDFTTAVRVYVTAHAGEADSHGNVSVPLAYTAASAGGIRLAGLELACDFPPRLAIPIPARSIDEDGANASLYDFSRYFEDDFDKVLDFSLVDVTNYTIALLRLVNGSVLSLDCTGVSSRDWSGQVSFFVQATDTNGQSALSDRVTVTVRPVNDPPRIIGSPPSFSALVGVEWRYDVSASDAENATLSYHLDLGPDGMSVDSATGRILWTPSAGQEGKSEVRLRVSDGQLADRQNFTINVTGGDQTNHPPRIMSTPVTVAEIGKKYSYQVLALDEDGDKLAYSLDKAPADLTIDRATGLMEWMPEQSQNGTHEVVARVSDSFISVTQGFNLTVTAHASDIRPTINITEPAPSQKVRGTIWIRGTAGARVGSVDRVELSVDLGDKWVVAGGKASWAYQLDTTRLADGKRTVFVRVWDTSGNAAQANITLVVANAGPKASAPASFLGLELWLWVLLLVVVCAAAGAGARAVVRRRPAAAPPATAKPSPAPAAAAAPAAGLARPAPPGKPAGKPIDSVFLIYHDGRLITYYSRSESIKLDETLDMIRKFVKASFSGQLGKLDSMRYENMNIIMERGNLMYMVAITPMAEPDGIRREMRHLLEDINNQYRVTFKIWDGDFTKVKGVKTMVERFAGEGLPVRSGTEQASAPPGPADEGAPSVRREPDAGPEASAEEHAEAPRPPEPAKMPAARESSLAPALAPVPPPEPERAIPLPDERPPARAGGLLSDGEEMDERPPPPPKTQTAAEEDGDDGDGPGVSFEGQEPAPKIPPVPVTRQEEASQPPERTRAAAGLTDDERLRLLEDRFLQGEITELTYRELRGKLGKK